MPKTVDISPEVADVLRRGEWRGWLFVLPPGQLDRKLYEAVNKVLVALGGKWARREGGHMFSLDAKPAMIAALEAGHAVDQKRTAEQFFTPATLAERMIDSVGLEEGMHALEPSAGNGAIVRQAMMRGAIVTAVEIDPALSVPLGDILESRGYRGDVICADFLTWEPRFVRPLDRVLMNPPFSQNQDIAHVRRAFDFLRPGGKLVAIMSPRFTFANDAPSRAFRELIGYPQPGELPHGQDYRYLCGSDAAEDCSVELLPAGAFKAEGTNIAAVLVTIEKAR